MPRMTINSLSNLENEEISRMTQTTNQTSPTKTMDNSAQMSGQGLKRKETSPLTYSGLKPYSFTPSPSHAEKPKTTLESDHSAHVHHLTRLPPTPTDSRAQSSATPQTQPSGRIQHGQTTDRETLEAAKTLMGIYHSKGGYYDEVATTAALTKQGHQHLFPEPVDNTGLGIMNHSGIEERYVSLRANKIDQDQDTESDPQDAGNDGDIEDGGNVTEYESEIDNSLVDDMDLDPSYQDETEGTSGNEKTTRTWYARIPLRKYETDSESN